MGDIPLRVLGHAFWFMAVNLFTLFRLTWLPIALLLAAQVALGQALAILAGGTTAALLEASPFWEPAFWLSAVLQPIALSVVAVRVHRLVLFDDRRHGEYFSFAFGRTEASYVAMVVLLISGVLAILLTVSGGVALLRDALQGFGVPVTSGEEAGYWGYAFVTVLAASFFAVVWIVLRLSLWPVVVVANDGIAMLEAWRVTRGYAWSMFWLFFVVQLALSFILLLVAILWDDDPGKVFKLLDQTQERHTLLGGWINPSVDIFAATPTAEQLAIDFALTFLVTAFIATVLSFTYLELKSEQATLHMGASAA